MLIKPFLFSIVNGVTILRNDACATTDFIVTFLLNKRRYCNGIYFFFWFVYV